VLIQDLPEAEGIMFLFKGEPGTGKTTAIGSFPEPIWIAAWDGLHKMRVLKRRYPDKHIEVEEFATFLPFFNRLEQLQERCDFRTVAIDSVTLLVDGILRTMLNTRGGRTDERGQRISAQDAKTTRGGIMLLEVEDYGGEIRGLTQTFDKLKAIQIAHRCNIIVTAHVIAATYKNVKGVTSTSRELFTAGKKIAAKLPVYFSEQYHFDVHAEAPIMVVEGAPAVEPHYSILTRHMGDDFAESMLGLPAMIDITDTDLYPILQTYMVNQPTKQTEGETT
jgi:hypothetical protein